jgi:hypothetical protein
MEGKEKIEENWRMQLRDRGIYSRDGHFEDDAEMRESM